MAGSAQEHEKIQDRLHAALCSSESSRSTYCEKPPVNLSPRKSAHERLAGTTPKSAPPVKSPFDARPTSAEHISRTSVPMAHASGSASSWDIAKPPGVFDNVTEDPYTGRTSHGPTIPSLPLERVHPDSLHPNTLTTIYVANIAFDADERDIVKFFNSVGGTFGDYCTALSAVNIPYKRDRKGRPIFAGHYVWHIFPCVLRLVHPTSPHV